MVLKPRVNTVTMEIMIAFWKFFDVLCWLIWIKTDQTLNSFTEQTFVCTDPMTWKQIEYVIRDTWSVWTRTSI